MSTFFKQFNFPLHEDEQYEDAFERLALQRPQPEKFKRKHRARFEQAVRMEEEVNAVHVAASLLAFFQQFPGFVVPDGEDFLITFYRLCAQKGWVGAHRKHVRSLFDLSIHAMLGAMNFDRLEALQQLIQEYGLVPEAEMPNTISGCRVVLSRLHVNIYDYVSGDRAIRFDSAHKLAEYSRKHKKIFSKARAKQNHATKILLRAIFF
jgi:hypothetical protein